MSEVQKKDSSEAVQQLSARQDPVHSVAPGLLFLSTEALIISQFLNKLRERQKESKWFRFPKRKEQ